MALGQSVLVEADLADGRLVKPFELTIPLDYAYYLVSPEGTAERPKVAAFRQWIMEEAGRCPLNTNVAPPIPWRGSRHSFPLTVALGILSIRAGPRPPNGAQLFCKE